MSLWKWSSCYFSRRSTYIWCFWENDNNLTISEGKQLPSSLGFQKKWSLQATECSWNLVPVVMWWSHTSTTVDSSTALSSSENLQIERFSSLSPVNRNKQKPNFLSVKTDRGAYFLNTARTYNPKVKLSIWGTCHGKVGQFAYHWVCIQWLGHTH